jgi:hypothetical protein
VLHGREREVVARRGRGHVQPTTAHHVLPPAGAATSIGAVCGGGRAGEEREHENGWRSRTIELS